MPTQKFQIQLFLTAIKETITSRNFYVVQRDKNNAFLAKSGMTPKEREKIILSLESTHFMAGPKPDHNSPSEDVWEFKTRYNNKEIYIKLKLIRTPNKNIGKCLSFHECEK